METGMEHVPVIPIILAVIIIGVAIYVIRRRRRNQPNGHDE
jgi:LPXTG-motif cell wall-anchored protein